MTTTLRTRHIIALLALPFEPSYTTLKSLRQKVSNYTITSNLSTDLHPYLNNAIAVRVVEVKKGVERVDTKVNEVKAKVTKVKAQVDKINKKVNEVNKKVDKVDKKVDEVNKKVDEVDKKVNEVKTEIAEIKTQMKSIDERYTTQVNDVKLQVMSLEM
ncbi:hypothetical protein V2W45_1430806 [Cenococcum geophilum]